MKKDRIRLFSKKDGRTFFQDLHKIKAEIEIFFDSMPVKLKSWMYEATIIIDALQKLDDALQDGEPADKAIDFILGQIKGDADEKIYEAVKVALGQLNERLEMLQVTFLGSDASESEIKTAYGGEKMYIASSNLMGVTVHTRFGQL